MSNKGKDWHCCLVSHCQLAVFVMQLHPLETWTSQLGEVPALRFKKKKKQNFPVCKGMSFKCQVVAGTDFTELSVGGAHDVQKSPLWKQALDFVCPTQARPSTMSWPISTSSFWKGSFIHDSNSYTDALLSTACVWDHEINFLSVLCHSRYKGQY